MKYTQGTNNRAASLHQGLIDSLKRLGYLRTCEVEAAFRAVPRHLFLPKTPLADVYANQVVVTKTSSGQPISSASQPAMMALMLDQLQVRPGHRVLEVGTGSGYNAALLAHLVGQHGRVVTIELEADLAASAAARLRALGFEHVEAICGDGGHGAPQAAPFDRILLTASADDITPAWWSQLAPNGHLVLPLDLWNGFQASIAFARDGDGLVGGSACPCLFMGLRGEFSAADDAPPPCAPFPTDRPPRLDAVCVRAYPRATAPPPHPDALVLHRPQTRFELRWIEP